MLSAAALVLLAVLSLFIADSIRTYAGLKQFGGHWSAGWSRIWLLKANASGRMNKVFTTINDEYGMSYHLFRTHDPATMAIGLRSRTDFGAASETSYLSSNSGLPRHDSLQTRSLQLAMMLYSGRGCSACRMLTTAQARRRALGRRCSSPQILSCSGG